MKPFRFRLETLLDFRKTQKEQSQIAFLQATHQLHIERELAVELEDKLATNIAFFNTCQQQPLSIEIFKSVRYYVDKISDDITTQQQKIISAQQHQQECLGLLEVAEKNHKIVEKYREKKFQQYQDEALREEQKILDEIGLQIYIKDK